MDNTPIHAAEMLREIFELSITLLVDIVLLNGCLSAFEALLKRMDTIVFGITSSMKP
jgi:hypothetical protein